MTLVSIQLMVYNDKLFIEHSILIIPLYSSVDKHAIRYYQLLIHHIEEIILLTE